MLGGITPEPPRPVPAPSRNEPPPWPIPRSPDEPDIEDRDRPPCPIPSDPDIGDKLNEGRAPLIAAEDRGRNESEEPPPDRPGMNPSVRPP